MTNEEILKVNDDVKDLLNQIMIKVKNVPVYLPEHEGADEDGFPNYKTYEIPRTASEDEKKVALAQIYIENVGAYCERMAKGSARDAEETEFKYYDSRCY